MGGLSDYLEQQANDDTRRLWQSLAQPVFSAAGDSLAAPRLDQALELLLRWGISMLRPDRSAELDVSSREMWLERPSWRPFFALAGHYGFLSIPDFPDRYYRKRGESAADNLCGLWGIGASTFYRCIDTAKRRLATLLGQQQADARYSAQIRDFVRGAAYRGKQLDTTPVQKEWHRAQATTRLAAGDDMGALWHLRMAGDLSEASHLLTLHAVKIASKPEVEQELDALILSATHPETSPSVVVMLHLAIGAIRRVQNNPAAEHAAYERALRIAAAAQDPTGMGIIYSHLGKYFEPRDSDRAFAYYQESIDFFTQGNSSALYPDAKSEYVSTLIQLAWLYTLRNDPRAKTILERAQALSDQLAAAASSMALLEQALLEQAWGEYWRRTGDFSKGLEYKHRALNIYERLGDEQGMLKTYINLGVLYDDLKQYARAKEYYERVLTLASRISVDPEHIASTYLNLGACYYWVQDYATAIQQYEQALALSEQAGLTLHIGRAHYNIAEVHYTRFRRTQQTDDERQGDEHVAAAIAAWETEHYPVYIESARMLKQELLGGTKTHAEHRLLSEEKVEYYAEMAEIEKQRALLASDPDPHTQIAARLSITKAYLSISAQEREAALRLCEQHHLLPQFSPEIDSVWAAYAQSQNQTARVLSAWRAQVQMEDAELRPLIRHLLEVGYITKSAYVQLRGISPATASKHLVRLAQAGLLEQVGKGAGTRYRLPAT
jgi:tetratricopeptide (TPR) repeat protein